MKIQYNPESEAWETKENGISFSHSMTPENTDDFDLVFRSFEDYFDYFDLEEEFYQLLAES